MAQHAKEVARLGRDLEAAQKLIADGKQALRWVLVVEWRNSGSVLSLQRQYWGSMVVTHW